MSSPHLTPEEFRRHGHDVVDWIADYWDSVGERPVLAQVHAGRQVAAALPTTAPEDPESLDAVLADLIGPAAARRDPLAAPAVLRLLPGQLLPRRRARRPALQRHRRPGDDLGHQPGRHRARAGGARLVAPGARPARRLRRETAPAVASSRTPRPPPPSPPCWPRCTARAAARPARTAYRPDAYTIYGSTQAHSSLLKAAMMSGLGEQAVRSIAVDPVTQAMDVDALRDGDRGRPGGRV